MNDLDATLRSVAHALVDDAPPPPPFPDAPPHAVAPRRRPFLYLTAAAAVAVVIGAAVAVWPDEPTRVVTAEPDEPHQPPTEKSYTCAAEPALRVTVPHATRGPAEGPAPGTPSLSDGQRGLHWMTADGIVDLRWPAKAQPLYNDGTAIISTLSAGESVSPGHSEIDVAPTVHASDIATGFNPDIIIESRDPAVPAPTAPCYLLEVTVITKDGQWHSGLRVAKSTAEFGLPAERIDLQPLIVERRSVDVAPVVAVPCQGSDGHNRPRNRIGGLDRSLAGARPADVLLAYLAANPGAPPSGYVEMSEPDGSITYAVDPSGIGWTLLLFLTQEAGNWFLEGWTSSGC